MLTSIIWLPMAAECITSKPEWRIALETQTVFSSLPLSFSRRALRPAGPRLYIIFCSRPGHIEPSHPSFVSAICGAGSVLIRPQVG